MSSNIPLINPTEDKIQDNIGNLQTEKQKASDSYSEKPLSKDNEKYMALNKLPSLEKSKSSSKTETENTLKLDTKKRSLPLASSDDKNMEKPEPTEITTKANKLARDSQSLSCVSVSLDGDSIQRKKEKNRNFQKFQ